MFRLDRLCIPRVVVLFSYLRVLDAFTGGSSFMLGTLPRGHVVFFQMSQQSVIDRLDLSDNFNRWRFLQNFLDAEVDASDANELLYLVLNSFLDDVSIPSNKLGDPESPITVAEIRDLIDELVKRDGKDKIAAFRDPQCSPGDDDVIDKLERLLPDRRENEDAFKGCWDTVVDLHGREAVRINEGRSTPQWRALCVVARVLIHFDFLARGVPSAGTR